MAEDDRKTALTTELAVARERVTANFHELRKDLDFPKRAKRAFARQPIAWTGGASLLGLILARLLFRGKKVVVVHKGGKAMVEKAEKAGLLIGILKIVFDLVRPAFTKWATVLLTDFARKKMGTSRSV
jgi:hypothetical protein